MCAQWHQEVSVCAWKAFLPGTLNDTGVGIIEVIANTVMYVLVIIIVVKVRKARSDDGTVSPYLAPPSFIVATLLPSRDASVKAALLLAEMEDVEYVAPKEKLVLFNNMAT